MPPIICFTWLLRKVITGVIDKGSVCLYNAYLNSRRLTFPRFCAALKVVTFAVSLGHDESLIFPQPSYDERIALYPPKFRKGFIRFSVGLEDPEDVIHDLDQALRAVGL